MAVAMACASTRLCDVIVSTSVETNRTRLLARVKNPSSLQRPGGSDFHGLRIWVLTRFIV